MQARLCSLIAVIAVFFSSMQSSPQPMRKQAVPSTPSGQQSPVDPGMLARLTTLVEVDRVDGTKDSGTGFFFQVLGNDPTPNANTPHWVQIKEVYVITTKHLIDPEHLASLRSFTFNLRRRVGDHIEWVPVTLTRQELEKHLHMEADSAVDVAAVRIDEFFNDLIAQEFKLHPGKASDIETYSAVSKENFPENNTLTIASSDDVIVVGYPHMFYDDFNKLPISKQGILITPWGLKFRGKDSFLIDYKGYHGASGSIVVSKPTQIAFSNGRIVTSESKQFLFLGMYSDEPTIAGEVKETDDAVIQEKVRVDLGEVFYYYTIQKAIDAPAFAN